MRAELHKRLISMLTFPMLPFLAVPFALGRRRNQRAYRFGIALVLLVAFHEIIEQGAIATRAQRHFALAHHVAAFRCRHRLRRLAVLAAPASC